MMRDESQVAIHPKMEHPAMPFSAGGRRRGFNVQRMNSFGSVALPSLVRRRKGFGNRFVK
jgi:hypothetical protein